MTTSLKTQAQHRIAALNRENAAEHLSWARRTLLSWPPHSHGQSDSKNEDTQGRTEVLTLRAHALREIGTPDSLREAVLAYDAALEALGLLSHSHDDALINQTASLWMKRGISLLTLADQESLERALPCFEKAIELRKRLPFQKEPWYRWGLSAAWMNRGDVLTRLGGESRLEEAVHCYDIAMAQLHGLPLDEKPEFRRRLALAWMNRGHTLRALTREDTNAQAMRSIDNALAVLRGHEESSRLDYRQVLAGAWTNKANLLLDQKAPDSIKAMIAARTAIRYCQTDEETDVLMAETGVQARHALCRAAAHLLEQPSVDVANAEEWIAEATDAVEDSLRVARLWNHAHGVTFQPLLEELFHFGTRIYRAFQPHFLAEFLCDGLSVPTPEGGASEAMQMAAREALGQAALQFQSEGLVKMTPEKLERLLQTLADLKDAGEQFVRPKEQAG